MQAEPELRGCVYYGCMYVVMWHVQVQCDIQNSEGIWTYKYIERRGKNNYDVNALKKPYFFFSERKPDVSVLKLKETEHTSKDSKLLEQEATHLSTH